MSGKDWLFTILGTAILVALVVFIISPKKIDDLPAGTTIFNNLVGKAAPDFVLTDHNNDQVFLSKLRGKNVVLFFNEGLMCYPSCWNQMAALGQEEGFTKRNTVALSVTVDPPGNWKEAVAKMPELAKARVLFDTDKRVSAKYGVLNLPSSMHRGQFPGHSYVVIDKNGVVRFTHDDPEMAVRNKELLNEIESIMSDNDRR